MASGLICLVIHYGALFVGKGENAGPPPGFKGRDEQTKRRRASKAYQDDRWKQHCHQNYEIQSGKSMFGQD